MTLLNSTSADPMERIALVHCANRARWLEARRDFVTASDAAKILGLSKFGTVMDVWVDKCDPNPPIDRSHLEGGRRFESAILEWYADVTGIEIEFANPFEIYVVDTHGRVGATLDAIRLGEERTPVDAKMIDRPKASEWGEPGTDAIPIDYATQLVVQMAALDAPFAELAVRFPSQAPVGFRVYRDEEVERDVLDRLQDFYERFVLTGERPPIDGSEAYADYLKSRLTQSSMEIIPAEPEMHAIVMKRREAKERLEQAESDVRYLDNLIKATIGEKLGLKGPNWRATWRTDRDSEGTDWEEVARKLARQMEFANDRRDYDVDMDTDAIDARVRERLFRMAGENTRVTRRGPRKLVVKYDDVYPVSPTVAQAD